MRPIALFLAVSITASMLEVASNENKTSALGGFAGSVRLALALVVRPGNSVASISAATKLLMAAAIRPTIRLAKYRGLGDSLSIARGA